MFRSLLLCGLLLSGCSLLFPPPPEPVKREPINNAPGAPEAIGPYSQAIRVGNALYCSGQIAINPATGDLIIGDAKEEARQALKNLGAVLQAAGMGFDNAVKVTVFLTNINDYKIVNEAYQEFFKEPYPAREAVQVAQLPGNAKVEISCIAIKTDL